MRVYARILTDRRSVSTQAVPIARLAEGGREGVMMRWGLIPSFALTGRACAPFFSRCCRRISSASFGGA